MNLMQQIMEEMRQKKAARDITNTLEKNGYEVVTENIPGNMPAIPASSCGCGSARADRIKKAKT